MDLGPFDVPPLWLLGFGFLSNRFVGAIMNWYVHNLVVAIFVIAILIAVGTVMYSCVFMLLRWKTPQRRRHVLRLVAATIAIPSIIGIEYGYVSLVVIPALTHQRKAEFDATKARMLKKASLVNVGDPVPHFSVTTVDGETWSLPAKDDVVLINFFATWCGPCQMELPHIQRLWEANKDVPHFRMVVIGREETAETLREFRATKGYSFPIAADVDRAIFACFATELIPRTLLVSPDGQIVFSKAGYSLEDLDELNTVLQEQLSRLKQPR